MRIRGWQRPRPTFQHQVPHRRLWRLKPGVVNAYLRYLGARIYPREYTRPLTGVWGHTYYKLLWKFNRLRHIYYVPELPWVDEVPWHPPVHPRRAEIDAKHIRSMARAKGSLATPEQWRAVRVKRHRLIVQTTPIRSVRNSIRKV